MELHEKLYNLRKKNGYTQAELAEMLGVSRQSVSNWELGSIRPSTSRLKKLSELYSVPVESLLDDNIEVQLHFDPIPCDTQDKNLEISKNLTEQGEGKTGWTKKAILFFVLGLFLAVLVGAVIYFVATGNSRRDNPILEQLGNEEVTISSGNGFDFQ